MQYPLSVETVAAIAFSRAADGIAHDLRQLRAHLSVLSEQARMLALEDRLTDEALHSLVSRALRLEAWLRPGGLN